MNKFDQAREQVFYAELTTQLADARQRATSERERLIRSLGLWGSDLAFTLPKSLPTLPQRPRTLAAVEQEAIRRRIDLKIARIELETLAKSYGLTQATRFINVLDARLRRQDHKNGRPATHPAPRLRGRLSGPDVRFRRGSRCARPSNPTCRPSIG